MLPSKSNTTSTALKDRQIAEAMLVQLKLTLEELKKDSQNCDVFECFSTLLLENIQHFPDLKNEAKQMIQSYLPNMDHQQKKPLNNLLQRLSLPSAEEELNGQKIRQLSMLLTDFKLWTFFQNHLEQDPAFKEKILAQKILTSVMKINFHHWLTHWDKPNLESLFSYLMTVVDPQLFIETNTEEENVSDLADFKSTLHSLDIDLTKTPITSATNTNVPLHIASTPKYIFSNVYPETDNTLVSYGYNAGSTLTLTDPGFLIQLSQIGFDFFDGKDYSPFYTALFEKLGEEQLYAYIIKNAASLESLDLFSFYYHNREQFIIQGLRQGSWELKCDVTTTLIEQDILTGGATSFCQLHTIFNTLGLRETFPYREIALTTFFALPLEKFTADFSSFVESIPPEWWISSPYELLSVLAEKINLFHEDQYSLFTTCLLEKFTSSELFDYVVKHATSIKDTDLNGFYRKARTRFIQNVLNNGDSNLQKKLQTLIQHDIAQGGADGFRHLYAILTSMESEASSATIHSYIITLFNSFFLLPPSEQQDILTALTSTWITPEEITKSLLFFETLYEQIKQSPNEALRNSLQAMVLKVFNEQVNVSALGEARQQFDDILWKYVSLRGFDLCVLPNSNKALVDLPKNFTGFIIQENRGTLQLLSFDVKKDGGHALPLVIKPEKFESVQTKLQLWKDKQPPQTFLSADDIQELSTCIEPSSLKTRIASYHPSSMTSMRQSQDSLRMSYCAEMHEQHSHSLQPKKTSRFSFSLSLAGMFSRKSTGSGAKLSTKINSLQENVAVPLQNQTSSQKISPVNDCSIGNTSPSCNTEKIQISPLTNDNNSLQELHAFCIPRQESTLEKALKKHDPATSLDKPSDHTDHTDTLTIITSTSTHCFGADDDDDDTNYQNDISANEADEELLFNMDDVELTSIKRP